VLLWRPANNVHDTIRTKKHYQDIMQTSKLTRITILQDRGSPHSSTQYNMGPPSPHNSTQCNMGPPAPHTPISGLGAPYRPAPAPVLGLGAAYNPDAFVDGSYKDGSYKDATAFDDSLGLTPTNPTNTHNPTP
jgi:hypothetical protein